MTTVQKLCSLLNLYYTDKLQFELSVGDVGQYRLRAKLPFSTHENFMWSICITIHSNTSSFDLHTELSADVEISIKHKLIVSRVYNEEAIKRVKNLDELFSIINDFRSTMLEKEYSVISDEELYGKVLRDISPIKDGRLVGDYTFATRAISLITQLSKVQFTNVTDFEYDYVMGILERLLEHQKMTVVDEFEKSYLRGQ